MHNSLIKTLNSNNKLNKNAKFIRNDENMCHSYWYINLLQKASQFSIFIWLAAFWEYLFYLQYINCTQAKQLGIVLKVLYLVGNLVQHGVHICVVALCLKHNMGIPQDFGMTTEGEQTLSLGGDALEWQRYVNMFNNDESV